MSFSFSYMAASKHEALDRLAAQYAPASVKDFISVGISNIRDQTLSDGKVISVAANGHLCDGPASYETTTAKIEVRVTPQV